MKARNMRGSAFVTVIAVLALLSILMETALALLVSHVTDSRRRGDAAYAGELARSGLEWGRARVAAGAGAASGRLEVAGGVIDVTSRLDGEMIAITSKGTVVRGQTEGPSREAATRVRPPEPGGETAPGPVREALGEPGPPPPADPVESELEAPRPTAAPAPVPTPAPEPGDELGRPQP